MMKRVVSLSAAVSCWLLLIAGALHAADAIALTAPRELEVVQRNAENQADVTISGSVSAEANLVEAKAELAEGSTTGKATGWIKIAARDGIAGGKFAGKLTLAAGGWYTISVRARRGEMVVSEAQIAKVGVGEVFVTAGQSNSANYGKPRQSAKDGRVVYFNGTAFVPAKDPIPGGSGGGGSPWPILGDQIARSQGVPVCFRSATLTWTEVKNWLPPDTRLYRNLVKCVGEFGEGGVRAVLWHQGESDSLAKTPAETYFTRLKTVVETLNKDAGYKLPWFVAQASFHPGSKPPQEKEVARGQQLLWERGVAHAGAVTDDLGQEYRSDRVHFNQRGLTAHAQRWFGALAEVYGWE